MNPAKLFLQYLSIFGFLVFGAGCSGTQSTVTRITDAGTLVAVDQSDNGYVLRGRRSLIKYDFRNHPSDRYDFDLTIQEIGLSTDLRLYGFNSDFQKFYILDRYLNLISHFEFNEYFDFLVRHPVLANGQNIWLYNQTENKLQEYSTQLEFLTETRNLNWDIPNVRVDQLLFHRNDVYLVDHSRGIFVYDYAGRLKQRFPLPERSSNVQIDKVMNRIFAWFTGSWNYLDPDETIPAFRKVNFPFADHHNQPDQVIFQNGKIYIWNRDRQEMEVLENRYLPVE